MREATYRLEEMFNRERLEDEALGRDIVAAEQLFVESCRSEDHDGYRVELRIAPEFLDQLESVHAGQIHIQEDDVRRTAIRIFVLLPQISEGFLAITDNVHRVLELGLAESFLCQTNVARVVFYEQKVDE